MGKRKRNGALEIVSLKKGDRLYIVCTDLDGFLYVQVGTLKDASETLFTVTIPGKDIPVAYDRNDVYVDYGNALAEAARLCMKRIRKHERRMLELLSLAARKVNADRAELLADEIIG